MSSCMPLIPERVSRPSALLSGPTQVLLSFLRVVIALSLEKRIAKGVDRTSAGCQSWLTDTFI